jgi:hypothetical protein
MSGAIPLLSDTPSWRGAQLKKHRDIFTFTFNNNNTNNNNKNNNNNTNNNNNNNRFGGPKGREHWEYLGVDERLT